MKAFAEYNERIKDTDGKSINGHWCVIAPVEGSLRSVLLWGFGSEIDAQIAAAFFDELNPDYSLESPFFWWQFDKHGGSRDGVMKAVCARLRW